jgi:hypothetical protein
MLLSRPKGERIPDCEEKAILFLGRKSPVPNMPDMPLGSPLQTYMKSVEGIREAPSFQGISSELSKLGNLRIPADLQRGGDNVFIEGICYILRSLIN